MKNFLSKLFGVARSSQGAKNPRRVNRRPEPLEDRTVPAVVVGLADNNTTLVIRGDATGAASDKVEIRENHDARNNGIDVRFNFRADGTFTSRRFDSDQVRKIVANLGAGADTFDYRLLSNYENAKAFEINLGSGNDSANFYMNRDIETTLNIKVWGGSGNDTAWSQFGKVDDDVTLAYWADLGTGDDRLPLFFSGDIEEDASVLVRVFGGTGNDTLSVASLDNTHLERDALFQVQLFGGGDNDQLGFYFRGKNDGAIDLTVDGQAGFDTRNDGYHPTGGRGQYIPRLLSAEQTILR